MPKQELLSFIQKKLQEGVSRNDLEYKLTSHGWPLAEIYEGFDFLAANPHYSAQPQPQSQMGAPAFSNAQPQVIWIQNELWIYQPSLLTGILAIVIGSLASTGFFFISAASVILGTLAVISIAISVISGIIGGLLLHFITSILNVQGRSISKAFVYTGAMMIIGFLLSLLFLVGAPALAVFIITLIAGFGLFIYYYQVSFLKGLAAFGLGIVFSVIFSIILSVIGMVIGVGIFGSILSSFNSGLSNNPNGVYMDGLPVNMQLNQY